MLEVICSVKLGCLICTVRAGKGKAKLFQKYAERYCEGRGNQGQMWQPE